MHKESNAAHWVSKQLIYTLSSSLFSSERMEENIMRTTLWDARSLRSPQFFHQSPLLICIFTPEQIPRLISCLLSIVKSAQLYGSAQQIWKKNVRDKIHALKCACFICNNWGGQKLASHFWRETIDLVPFSLYELSDLQLFFNIPYYTESNIHIAYVWFAIFNKCEP